MKCLESRVWSPPDRRSVWLITGLRRARPVWGPGGEAGASCLPASGRLLLSEASRQSSLPRPYTELYISDIEIRDKLGMTRPSREYCHSHNQSGLVSSHTLSHDILLMSQSQCPTIELKGMLSNYFCSLMFSRNEMFYWCYNIPPAQLTVGNHCCAGWPTLANSYKMALIFVYLRQKQF